MASNRRRWKYRDPSWFQIGYLYLLAAIFMTYPTPPRIAYAILWALSVTVLVVIKVVRESGRQTEEDIG